LQCPAKKLSAPLSIEHLIKPNPCFSILIGKLIDVILLNFDRYLKRMGNLMSEIDNL
jgi:hypothetical protein